MKKLGVVQEGERVLGPLSAEHLAIRKASLEAQDNYTRGVRKVELDCELQDREPTKTEKKEVHRLHYVAEVANLDMWKVLNDDFEAWETPIGIRIGQNRVAVLVELVPNPLTALFGIMRHGH